MLSLWNKFIWTRVWGMRIWQWAVDVAACTVLIQLEAHHKLNASVTWGLILFVGLSLGLIGFKQDLLEDQRLAKNVVKEAQNRLPLTQWPAPGYATVDPDGEIILTWELETESGRVRLMFVVAKDGLYAARMVGREAPELIETGSVTTQHAVMTKFYEWLAEAKG